MNIVTMIDRDFTDALAVLLRSLVDKAGLDPSAHQVHVYQLGHGLSQVDEALLELAWGEPVVLHSLAEVPKRDYKVSDIYPLWQQFKRKVDLLGVPLEGPCVWMDADMIALGPLPELFGGYPGDTVAMGYDVGGDGHNMNGEAFACSSGVMVYTPSPERCDAILRYSEEAPRNYLYGDQQLISWYMNEVEPHNLVRLEHSAHFNVRMKAWHPDLWDAERPTVRLLHWGGPKPWDPLRGKADEAELWHAARAELRS